MARGIGTERDDVHRFIAQLIKERHYDSAAPLDNEALQMILGEMKDILET